MTHIRKQLRDAVVAAVTGLTTTGARVYSNRVWPLGEERLPGLLVFLGDEDIEIDAMGGALSRQVNIHVVAMAVESANMEDELDNIAKEVEIAMATDSTFGDLLIESHLAALRPGMSGDGEKIHGRLELRYEGLYSTTQADPETAL